MLAFYSTTVSSENKKASNLTEMRLFYSYVFYEIELFVALRSAITKSEPFSLVSAM
jgi:hypothetical protein